MLVSGGAQAALIVLPDDRFVYDDVLDVTWLRDANASLGSSFDTANGGAADGLMNWANANAWASSLTFTLSGPGGSATFDQWRLPTATEVNSPPRYGSDGSGDSGYNITRTSSELSYMYYRNLGNAGYCSAAGDCSPQPAFSLTRNWTFVDAATGQQASFENLRSQVYWSSTAYSPAPLGFAWLFNFYSGFQQVDFQATQAQGWAVHAGRVMAPVPVPVPVPGTWLMVAAGLGGLGWLARGRRRFGVSGASAP